MLVLLDDCHLPQYLPFAVYLAFRGLRFIEAAALSRPMQAWLMDGWMDR